MNFTWMDSTWTSKLEEPKSRSSSWNGKATGRLRRSPLAKTMTAETNCYRVLRSAPGGPPFPRTYELTDSLFLGCLFQLAVDRPHKLIPHPRSSLPDPSSHPMTAKWTRFLMFLSSRTRDRSAGIHMNIILRLVLLYLLLVRSSAL